METDELQRRLRTRAITNPFRLRREAADRIQDLLEALGEETEYRKVLEAQIERLEKAVRKATKPGGWG